MIWKKKNNLTKKNNHVKNDNFQRDNLDQFNMIDLGEEYFISPYEEDKLIAIPELKDINTTSDKKVEPMINLSYPDDVKYVHKKYQRGKIKKQRKLKKTKKSLTIVLVICFIILGLIIYEIVKWQKDNIDTKKQIEDINKEVKVEEVKTTVQNQETPVTEEEQKLPNDYFDLILFECSLSIMSEPIKILSNCKKFLKKDGLILLSDFFFKKTDIEDDTYTLNYWNRVFSDLDLKVINFQDKTSQWRNYLGMVLWEYGELSGLLRGNQNSKINSNILKKETGYFLVTLGKKD